MKPVTSFLQPDVVLLYQDHEIVEPVIQQILALNLIFKSYQFNPEKLPNITDMKAKVVLLSSNNIKHTIQFYINYLEEYENNIAPHSAILLVNNREAAHAYLACENGLFDNYVIINPMHELFRLPLIIQKELKLITNQQKSSLKKLASAGEDELVTCIEHGVALKNNFLNEVKKCSDDILSAIGKIIQNKQARQETQRIIDDYLKNMNGNVTADLEGILDQLAQIKEHYINVKTEIERNTTEKLKSLVGINTKKLSELGTNNTNILSRQNSGYKILIAEPSELYVRIIADIFAETAFEYCLVDDGQDVLKQISNFNPDVLLLAYDLPTLNGIEVSKAIRNQGNKVPIIAYTHIRDKALIKRWIPLGLSGYLIKPSKKSSILKTVNEALKNPIEIIQRSHDDNNDEIKWIKAYSVGHLELDEQHKLLFAMINEFFHQEGKQAAVTVFQNLSSYIDLHFETEERILKQINYPETEAHIRKHEALKEKFNYIQKKLDNYNLDVHHKIGMFLYNWLAKHILKSDIAYKKYAVLHKENNFK